MEELKKVEEERRKGGAAGQKDTPGQEDTAG
jgi:spore maturation protein A